MTSSRNTHGLAAVVNGLALAAVALGRPGWAFTLLALSSLLLIWSLERMRVLLDREPRK